MKGIYNGREMNTDAAELVINADRDGVAEWSDAESRFTGNWYRSYHKYINRLYKDKDGYFLVTDNHINRECVYNSIDDFFSVPTAPTGEGQSAVLIPVNADFAAWTKEHGQIDLLFSPFWGA